MTRQTTVKSYHSSGARARELLEAMRAIAAAGMERHLTRCLTLRKGLHGYGDYARRIRWRLIPFLW